MGEMIERLDFSGKEKYSAVEATIHLNRYAMARPYVAGKRVLDVASGEGYGSFLLRRWGAGIRWRASTWTSRPWKPRRGSSAATACITSATPQSAPL